ncbi:hypothetical protein LINPERPRIM_LOCUS37894, partial [Linum perenne]
KSASDRRFKQIDGLPSVLFPNPNVNGASTKSSPPVITCKYPKLRFRRLILVRLDEGETWATKSSNASFSNPILERDSDLGCESPHLRYL